LEAGHEVFEFANFCREAGHAALQLGFSLAAGVVLGSAFLPGWLVVFVVI
jgi:hypothetical protein